MNPPKGAHNNHKSLSPTADKIPILQEFEVYGIKIYADVDCPLTCWKFEERVFVLTKKLRELETQLRLDGMRIQCDYVVWCGCGHPQEGGAMQEIVMEVVCEHKWGQETDVDSVQEPGVEPGTLLRCRVCRVVQGPQEKNPRVVIGRVQEVVHETERRGEANA